MNDVIMEEEAEKNLNVQIRNPSVETKGSKNEDKETKEVIKLTLKSCMFKKNSSNVMKKISLCWNFYCVNDNATIDLEDAQIMFCIFCHNNFISKF
jgi:hypothetical protein